MWLSIGGQTAIFGAMLWHYHPRLECPQDAIPFLLSLHSPPSKVTFQSHTSGKILVRGLRKLHPGPNLSIETVWPGGGHQTSPGLSLLWLNSIFNVEICFLPAVVFYDSKFTIYSLAGLSTENYHDMKILRGLIHVGDEFLIYKLLQCGIFLISRLGLKKKKAPINGLLHARHSANPNETSWRTWRRPGLLGCKLTQPPSTVELKKQFWVD